MIAKILDNPDTAIAIGTVIISFMMILLGLNEDVTKKKEQLKFVLISYVSLIILIIIFENVLWIFFVILCIYFLFGGIAYSNNKHFNLEKELNVFEWLIYSACSWFFITNNRILWTSLIMALFLKQSVWLSIPIMIAGLCYQYILIVRDYFGVNSFANVYENLHYINLEKLDNSKDEEINRLFNDNKELLSFILYVEDRNMFNRKHPHISLFDVRSALCKPNIFKDKIDFSKSSKKQKYCRGYSTIEQQLIRQFALKKNSYRYKYRRKIFFDWIYTPFFCKALCIRKSRVYGDKKKNAKKKLIVNLKLKLLLNYFELVLLGESNRDNLIGNMSKESRVEIKVYKRMHEIYFDSKEKSRYVKLLESARDSKFHF